MKETTLALSHSLRRIYVEEEPGQRSGSLLSMTWTMRMRIGFKSSTMKRKSLHLKSLRLCCLSWRFWIIKLEKEQESLLLLLVLLFLFFYSYIPQLRPCKSSQQDLQFSSLYTIIGKQSESDGKNLSCGACSLLHQLMIQIHTMCLDQEKKLTAFTQEGCKGGRTMSSPLKNFARRNLDQARTVLGALIEREEKKREVMESEVSLQRIQIKYKHQAQLVEDGFALSGFPSNSWKFVSSEDDFFDSDDTTSGHRHAPSAALQKPPFTDSKLIVVPAGRMKHEMRRRPLPHRWLHKKDLDEPVLLFTRPLDRDKLASAGIVQPPDPPAENGPAAPPYRFQGRIGRGGRIIFDRRSPRLQAPIVNEVNPYVPPNSRPPQPNG
ncbi:uncharacterized protein [Elaeis guineensis]|uniref:Uncharacterized protein LOC105038983 isoform X3 n=1 Tax=Elaeis guineensis var. tenera TaxID=51953 RepID=A0A6I9QS10_ELAGV|nr:uncharacterized protein LOC105038983 isoform X3 [Elaeis guineensis]